MEVMSLGLLMRTLYESYEIIPLRIGESFSLPFYATVGGSFYPAVFVYSVSPFSQDSEGRFLAHDLYVFGSSNLGEFRKMQVREFGHQQDVKFFSKFVRVPGIDLQEEYERALSLLDRIGVQLEISPEVARDLASAFVNVVPEGLRPIYFSAGFDFFKRVDDLAQAVR